MENDPSSVDPRRCPLCGEENACGVAAGATTCWCFEHPMPPEVIATIPAGAQGKACICRSCASEPLKGADQLVRRGK